MQSIVVLLQCAVQSHQLWPWEYFFGLVFYGEDYLDLLALLDRLLPAIKVDHRRLVLEQQHVTPPAQQNQSAAELRMEMLWAPFVPEELIPFSIRK